VSSFLALISHWKNRNIEESLDEKIILIYFSVITSTGHKLHRQYQNDNLCVKTIPLSVIVLSKERGINAHIQVKMVQ